METTNQTLKRIYDIAAELYKKLNNTEPVHFREYFKMAIEIEKIEKLSILDDIDSRLNILNDIDNTLEKTNNTLQETKYKLQEIATQIQFTY